MIWFFTPYSFNKKLFQAYDDYMNLVQDPTHWCCICDGDAAFLLADFGNQVQDYIDKYPDTGMFVCYASRSPYGHQMAPGIDPESDSIKYIFDNTLRMYEQDHLRVIEMHQRVAAPILVIKKAKWNKYRDQIAAHAVSANIQAVDTAISDILKKNGEKILLMAGIQVYHYFRQYSRSEKHILSDKLTVVIRTHSRPKMFERCLTSVLNQTHKHIDIVVGVDNEESYNYAIEAPVKVIRVTPRERTSQKDFPANEYISALIADITDGYILILDDDAYLDDPMGVEKLFREIDKEWCLYILRYHYPDGRLFPNDMQFKNRIIQEGGIDWGSFVFHARFARIVKSLPLYNADYYFIRDLNSHVKTTKWINLPLVHTDTPGMNGLTESEMNSPEMLKRTHDVVYILGNGSSWANNEIRVSVRSFVKYFENLRNIVIVGECPVFMDGVIHIPYADHMGVNKDCRMMMKIRAACMDNRVSDNFILCTDDTLLLTPLKSDDFKGWHDGAITYESDEHIMQRGDQSNALPSEWFKWVRNTGWELRTRNLPDNNYDRAHCPQPVNKYEFRDILSKWDMSVKKYTISNIYNNSSKLFTGENIAGKTLKVYHPATLEQLSEMTADKLCMNYNDNALDNNLKTWLHVRFPEATKYERFITDPDRRKTVEEWFKNGCNYDDGVKIFNYFAPKNRQLKIFLERKKESERAENKLKNTLSLWLR
ncbi:MAG: glycosyltransferase [Bacteroidales bacterium]